MSFLHISLLAGSLFIAVPILLHLLMRRRPRHEMFPALRFVKQLRQTNQQRLRLKNWLLLLLRCAIVVALAAAVARPTVASEDLASWLMLGGLGFVSILAAVAAIAGWQNERGRWLCGGLALAAVVLGLAAVVTFARLRGQGGSTLLTRREAPVAAALVFDTSPRMALRYENQSRLEATQEMGRWLLSELPENSEVAIVDNGTSSAVFSIDVWAAEKAIQALSVNTIVQPLARPLAAAWQLLEASDKQTKEIYLLTDLTRQSWLGSTANLADRLSDDDSVRVYVLDIGVENPQNLAIGAPRLSGEMLSRGTPLRIEAELLNTGHERIVTVELVLETPDPRLPMLVDGEAVLPELQLRNEQTVALASDSSMWVAFSLPSLAPGSHHGQIRLRGTDALEVDDTRYFTVQATDHWSVLVAGAPDAAIHFLTHALAPYEEQRTGQAPFRCDSMGVDELKSAKLTDYAAIALLDPPPLADGVWNRLAEYVDRGGGLGIFLGRNAQPVRTFNTAGAQKLLPGRLVRQWRAGARGLSLRLAAASHPLLAPFRPLADNIPWDPIFRHWVFDQVDDGNVVLRFSSGQPAIVERRIGRGRVLVMTTPISDPLNVRGRPAWNRLPTAIDPWPYWMLMDTMFRYLAQQGESRLNYEVGQPVSLTVPDDSGTSRYQLFVPTGVWQDVTAARNRVTLQFADVPGTYRLRSGRGDDQGFSMNLPTDATRLERIDVESLDRWFGPDGYRLARSRAEVNRDIGEARIGHEMYPWLLVLLVLLLTLEHVLANRFYSRRSSLAGADVA